jgi:hypothetical protein
MYVPPLLFGERKKDHSSEQKKFGPILWKNPADVPGLLSSLPTLYLVVLALVEVVVVDIVCDVDVVVV